MRRLALAGAFLLGLLGIGNGAHATCNFPNPNLSGPPFVDNCPLPASRLSNVLIGPGLTLTGTATIHQTETLTGSPGGPSFPNILDLTDNNLVIPGLAFMTGWSFTDNFGGSSATGGRQAFQAVANQISVTSSSNTFRSYVAGTFLAKSSVGDGGTNLTSDPRGNYFALNPYFLLQSGATNVGSATGGEVNSIVLSGATLKYKSLWNLVGGGGDAIQGNTWDDMLALSNQSGSVGHKTGILIGDMNGDWPISSTGTVMGVYSTGGIGTAANGIDFNPPGTLGISFSGCAFRSKGFSACINSIDGAMNTAGTYPISASFQYSLTDNLSNSFHEMNFVNDDTAATQSFSFIQKTGASAGTTVLAIGPTGLVTLPGITTGTATNFVCSDASKNLIIKATACQ